jgi:hypothetical protein
VFKTKLLAGTNAPVGVYGDTVVTAGSFPSGPGQKALIIAYRLGAKDRLPAPKSTTATPPAKKKAHDELGQHCQLGAQGRPAPVRRQHAERQGPAS